MTDEQLLAELRRDGIVVLPQTLDVGAFTSHLSLCPVYQNHVRQGKDPVPFGSHPWTCHEMHDVVAAPGLLEAALAVRSVAENYLGASPYLYSLNAFYCEPNSAPKGDIQDWHRDVDDSRFLALFAYCVDVRSEADGPHQFFCGSQRGAIGRSDPDTVLGSAGTMFLADTSGVHRGLVPTSRRRMIAWARWGVSCPPAAYQWDKLSPAQRSSIGDRYPSDPELQEAVKLVVA